MERKGKKGRNNRKGDGDKVKEGRWKDRQGCCDRR